MQNITVDFDSLSPEAVNEIAAQLDKHRRERDAQRARTERMFAEVRAIRSGTQPHAPIPPGVIVVDGRPQSEGGPR